MSNIVYYRQSRTFNTSAGPWKDRNIAMPQLLQGKLRLRLKPLCRHVLLPRKLKRRD